MGVNIYVVTKDEISPALLLKVLKNTGFATVAETSIEGNFYLGRKEQTIWAYLDNDELRFLEEPNRARINELLAGSPKDCINIAVSSTGNSERLAIEVVDYLLGEFTGVMYNFNDRVYSPTDIAKIVRDEPEPIL